MAFSLSEFFSHLYASATLFLTLLLLDLAIPIQSAIEVLCTTTPSTARRRRSQLSSCQFLNLVEENVPTTLYTKWLCPNDALESCSVCLSNFELGDEMRELSCEHKFHKECLDTWLKQDHQVSAAATCPLCRRMVLPEDIFCSHDDDDDGSDEDFVVYYLLYANRMM